jgi:hypothetical protein
MDDDLDTLGSAGTTGKQAAKATAAAPVLGEGDAVAVSVDLGGNVRFG